MTKTTLSQATTPAEAARGEIMGANGIINLNAGTCSPVPRPVFQRLVAQLEMQSADPAEYIWTTAVPLIEQGRQALAAFLSCDQRDLILCTNASYGVNTVLQTITWHRGDEILITDQEYHHYRNLLNLLVTQHGVTLKKIALPLSADATWTADRIVQLFAQSASSKTRAVFFSHITSPTGTCLPAAEICSWARRRNILSVIDGAHAPGHVPVALNQIGADFYTANTHKWMMNPAGCAFLYARADVRFKIRPLFVMGGFEAIAKHDESPTAFGSNAWQFAHEYQGTRNLTPMTVLADTINFYNSIGQDAIMHAWRENAAFLDRLLSDVGLEMVSPLSMDLATCMRACRVPSPTGKINTIAARSFFRATHNIELAFPSLEDGSSLIRISAAWFNTKDELEKVAQVLKHFDWSQFT